MLMLSRKKGEAIVIGDDIRVVVVEIGTNAVRLGIEADKKISVHRSEVYEEIQRDLAAGVPARRIEDRLDQGENEGANHGE